jgi:ComF family protein
MTDRVPIREPMTLRAPIRTSAAMPARAPAARHGPASVPTAFGAPAVALRALATRALDLLLPRPCAICAAALEPAERGLCAGCLLALPGLDACRCPRCGLRAPDRDTDCARCRRTPPAFDRTFVLADYGPPLDRLIVALKFGRQIGLGQALGEALAGRFGPIAGSQAGPLAWVAVPLGPERLRERGFNQADRIARAYATACGLAAPQRLLTRERDTRAQARLGGAPRRHNLEGALRATRPLAGRAIGVVDDVMTTGATLQATALALKAAGAVEVVNLVLARTPDPEPDGP